MILRHLGLALLIPINLSILVIAVAVWLGAWGGANIAFAVERHSLPALARGVDGIARSAGAASLLLRGWGQLASLAPALEPAAELGHHLQSASRIGRAAAPALVDALGGNGPKRYLVCSLNDAELFGSGGAPLDIAVVEINGWQPRLLASGSVGSKFNPGNAPYPWERIGGLPWYRPGKQYPFANSNFHPSFAFSGPNMISAWEALGQPKVDGVVTVDMFAVAAVLQETGPIQSAGYGRLTGANVIAKVLVEAYREFPEQVPKAQDRRREMNDQLRNSLMDRLLERRTVLGALRGLWSTIPGRHLQAFMVDSKSQAVVEAVGADAELSTNPGDILGIFQQSGVSKLAIFQQRRIKHTVVVHKDGSADVTQSVSFKNAVPDSLSGERYSHTGYLALISRQRVAFRIPLAATSPSVTVHSGRALVPARRIGPFSDYSGAKVMWQGQDIPPGESRVTTTTYRLPSGTFGPAGGLRYQLTADPQALDHPVLLHVQVKFDSARPAPRGGGQEGWIVNGIVAEWQGTLDRTLTLQLNASARSS